MSDKTMTPAEVLAVMDGHIEAITSLVGHNSPIGAEWPKARAAVAALVAERDALRESLQRIADYYESKPGLSVLTQVRMKAIARAALAGAGQ